MSLRPGLGPTTRARAAPSRTDISSPPAPFGPVAHSAHRPQALPHTAGLATTESVGPPTYSPNPQKVFLGVIAAPFSLTEGPVRGGGV